MNRPKPMSTNSQRPSTLLRRKRARVAVSCLACRIRKLKCNREKPCQNCIVRGSAMATACSYAETPDAKTSLKSNPRSDAEDMRIRISRLENSILQIMSGASDGNKTKHGMPPHPSNSHHLIEASDRTGGQKMSSDTRSTHWDAILNDLGAMKDVWSAENDHLELSNEFLPSPSKAHRPSFLNGWAEPPDRSTILLTIPPKDATDKLINSFFEHYNPAMPARYLVHKPTFLKQYRNHWDDPTKTQIMWIGLLFAILCVTMQSYRRNKEEPPEYQGGISAAIIELYRTRTAQCLSIADITKPVQFMIQTVHLFAMIVYSDEGDGDLGSYLLSGTLVRLALQEGYHRDPSQHPNISVFEGEMRRRIWAAVIQHELLFSVKSGLPMSIRYSECDTKPPSNLFEEDLYEDMKELPPSRPTTEYTTVSYYIMKCKILRAYGGVVQFLHVLDPQPYEEVLRLDASLMEAREMTPPHLQVRNLEEMLTDPPSLIMERYLLQLFYHKAICLLHRKYWHSTPADTVGTFFYSWKTCVASSVALLQLQNSMHQACRPGGPLVNMKWYHFALTNHDFLLAAMIICLDLMTIQKKKTGCSGIGDCTEPESEKFQCIRQSRAIWAEIVDECKDAKRAVSILNAVLSKLRAEYNKTPSMKETEIEASASVTNHHADSQRFDPYFINQFGLATPFIAEQPNEDDTAMQDMIFSTRGFLDSFGSDLSQFADFDWGAWDQFVATQPITQDAPNNLQIV